MTEFKMDPEKDPNEKIKPKYISRKGFVRVKVRRGFTEIMPLIDIPKISYHFQQENLFICGGYVRYMCSPNRKAAEAGDIDLYFVNIETFNECQKIFEGEGFEVKYQNDVSLGFKIITDIDSPYLGCPPVQLIKPILDGSIVATGTMEEILSNFDFTIIRCGLISPTDAMVDADFLHDETHNILRIKNIHCPISSTLRCMKYARKGYWLPPMQCCRLFLDWEERTQDYRDKILKFLTEADKGEGLTRADIDEMERLMRID